MRFPNYLKTVCLIPVLVLPACASLSLENKYPSYEYRTDYKILQEDRIIGLGKIKAEDKQASSTLLIGENYNYLLSDGGDDVLKIMQNLPVQERAIRNTLPLELDVYNDNVFYGHIHFYHPVPMSQLSAAKKQQLRALGFMEEPVSDQSGVKEIFLARNIAIKGTVYQAKPQQDNLSLTSSVPIVLREARLTTQENKANVMKKRVLMPVALAFDIVSLPIQWGAGKLANK